MPSHTVKVIKKLNNNNFKNKKILICGLVIKMILVIQDILRVKFCIKLKKFDCKDEKYMTLT